MAPAQPLIMSIVRFLHNLFTAAWIGGMFTLLVSVIPAVKGSEAVKEKKKVLFDIQKRLNPVAIASMLGLAVTGIFLGRGNKGFTGLFQFGTPYMTALSVKHILIILMLVVSYLRFRVVKGVCFIKLDPDKLSAGLLVLNVLLGIGILFLSSMV